MRRIFTLSLFCFSIFLKAGAQQLPLYTQYVFNPYMINPSMVAYSGRSEINLLYREQWTQIQDSPKSFQFDAQYRFSPKIAMGINIVNQRTVLLSATTANLAFGYNVRLAKEHTVGFGLAGGFFSNQLNLNEVAPADLQDPALLNARNNSIGVDGQFGVNYRFRDLSLGFSMVNLFDRKTFTSEKFQKTKLGQLKNQILFASYRFTLVPDTWHVQPSALYRLSEDGVNYYEASAFVSYKNLIDVGAGYRQSFGPVSMVRVHLKNIQMGFAYDFPSPTAEVSAGGTWEVQLKLKLGKSEEGPKKKLSTTVSPQENTAPPAKQEQIAVAKKEEVKDSVAKNVITTPKVIPSVNQPVKAEEIVKPLIQKEPYYLIAGTFEDRANANTFRSALLKRGIKAEIRESKHNSNRMYYYVYLPDYQSGEATVEKVLEIQKITGIKDAWYTRLD